MVVAALLGHALQSPQVDGQATNDDIGNYLLFHISSLAGTERADVYEFNHKLAICANIHKMITASGQREKERSQRYQRG